MRTFFLSIFLFVISGLEAVSCPSYHMKVSKEDGERITTIVHTVASYGYFALLTKKSTLDKLGDIVAKDVPSPFDFWAFILSHDTLKKDMLKIKQSPMKYNNFVRGMYDGMIREYNDPCFCSTARQFGAFLKLNDKEIEEMLTIAACSVKRAHQTQNKMAFKPFLNYLVDSVNGVGSEPLK